VPNVIINDTTRASAPRWRGWMVVPALLGVGCHNQFIDLTPGTDAACEAEGGCDDGDETDEANGGDGTEHAPS
jgi:hypothetical protein